MFYIHTHIYVWWYIIRYGLPLYWRITLRHSRGQPCVECLQLPRPPVQPHHRILPGNNNRLSTHMSALAVVVVSRSQQPVSRRPGPTSWIPEEVSWTPACLRPTARVWSWRTRSRTASPWRTTPRPATEPCWPGACPACSPPPAARFWWAAGFWVLMLGSYSGLFSSQLETRFREQWNGFKWKCYSIVCCIITVAFKMQKVMFSSPCIYCIFCMRVTRITQKVLNRIAWHLVGWLVIIRGPFV